VSQFQSSLPRCSLLYLKEFLWNGFFQKTSTPPWWTGFWKFSWEEESKDYRNPGRSGVEPKKSLLRGSFPTKCYPKLLDVWLVTYEHALNLKKVEIFQLYLSFLIYLVTNSGSSINTQKMWQKDKHEESCRNDLLRVCNAWHYLYSHTQALRASERDCWRKEFQIQGSWSFYVQSCKSARVERFSNGKHGYRLLVTIRNSLLSKTCKIGQVTVGNTSAFTEATKSRTILSNYFA